jgi:hypothetical protein
MLRSLSRQIVRVAPHAPYVLAKGAVMAAPTAGDIDTLRLMVRSKSAACDALNRKSRKYHVRQHTARISVLKKLIQTSKII